jgi:putative FmdB family regulatory protein
MPTFTFKCRCGEFDDLVPSGAKSAPCPKCGKDSKRLFSPTENIHIPAWMSALGSGSSERQAEYLKSDRHRKNRAKQEMDVEKAIQREDRIKANRAKLSHTIEARVADNAKYSDQSPTAVSKRAKEYRAAGFAK